MRHLARRTITAAAACAIALTGLAGQAGAQTDTPVALEPYLDEEGELSSTDYGWFGWKFSSEQSEKARWSALMHWAAETSEQNKREMQDRVRQLGYDPARVEGGCGSNETCEAILVTGLLHTIEDWSSAKSAIDEAVPLFTVYMSGIESIEAYLAENGDRELAGQLVARGAVEQALRSAITNASAKPENLSMNGSKAWRMLLWRETVERDLANTAWLKSVVASEGWPTRSKVGKEAAHAAWLLVQHADRDPAFQIRVLHMMEDLVPLEEVDPQDFAFLYDRVIGELKGKQRYGTQMVCNSGRFVPQDVEDPEGLARRREQVGLPPLKEQLDRFASRTC